MNNEEKPPKVHSIISQNFQLHPSFGRYLDWKMIKTVTIGIFAIATIVNCIIGFVLLRHCFTQNVTTLPVTSPLSLTPEDDGCFGDWVPYRDEKCYRVLPGVFRTFSEAVSECASVHRTATLPVFDSIEQQRFLTNHLFVDGHHSREDQFWIGAQSVAAGNNATYRWVDDTQLSYSDWTQGSPSSNRSTCVHLQWATVGQWVHDHCEQRHWVVCERRRQWSLATLQRTLTRVRHIADHVIAVGFVYHQLPNQSSPALLWPWMEWREISHAYAGLFTRVLGGHSKPFGVEQSPFVTRLGYVYTTDSKKFAGSWADLVDYSGTASVDNDGSWSRPVWTGGYKGAEMYTQFKLVTDSEVVRPRNTAIRLWVRIR